MPSGPRRNAENISSPVPVSASIWAGFMGTCEASRGPKTMRLVALLLATAFVCPVFAAADGRPGYGVIESVAPLRSSESASAGASAPSAGNRAAVYLVRVRMNDGAIQIRQVKKHKFAVGERVLLTNAGDVVPD
jgi:hypothetical protein